MRARRYQGWCGTSVGATFEEIKCRSGRYEVELSIVSVAQTHEQATQLKAASTPPDR